MGKICYLTEFECRIFAGGQSIWKTVARIHEQQLLMFTENGLSCKKNMSQHQACGHHRLLNVQYGRRHAKVV